MNNNESSFFLSSLLAKINFKNLKEMNFLEMKALAKKIEHECIIDKDGDICIRPMCFEDGIRQVLFFPSPCEFESPENAEKTLLAAAKESTD